MRKFLNEACSCVRLLVTICIDFTCQTSGIECHVIGSHYIILSHVLTSHIRTCKMKGQMFTGLGDEIFSYSVNESFIMQNARIPSCQLI